MTRCEVCGRPVRILGELSLHETREETEDVMGEMTNRRVTVNGEDSVDWQSKADMWRREHNVVLGNNHSLTRKCRVLEEDHIRWKHRCLTYATFADKIHRFVKKNGGRASWTVLGPALDDLDAALREETGISVSDDDRLRRIRQHVEWGRDMGEGDARWLLERVRRLEAENADLDVRYTARVDACRALLEQNDEQARTIERLQRQVDAYERLRVAVDRLVTHTGGRDSWMALGPILDELDAALGEHDA